MLLNLIPEISPIYTKTVVSNPLNPTPAKNTKNINILTEVEMHDEIILIDAKSTLNIIVFLLPYRLEK